MAGGKDDRLVALLERQIEATDRVNHAVRAIVIPSLIMLVAILLASPFLLIGFFVDYSGLALFLAGTILFVGAIWAIVSQIKESVLSAIPSGIALPSPDVEVSAGITKASSSPADAEKEELLSVGQHSDWVAAGKPELSTWDGQQSFSEWLKRNWIKPYR